MGRNVIILIVVVLVLLVGLGGAGLFLLTQVGGGSETADSGTSGGGFSVLPQEEAEPEEVQERNISVIAAAVDIDANTVLDDGELLTEVQIPESEFEDSPNNFATNINDVQGRLLTVPVSANDPINPALLATPGLSQQIPPADDGEDVRPKAYPVEVNSLAGVADQIRVGDFVDVVATISIEGYVQVTPSRIESVIDTSTKTVVQRAEVLRILRPRNPQEAETEQRGAQQASAPGEDPANPQEAQQRQAAEEVEELPTTITPGSWIVVLAVTGQEAEILQHIDQSSRVRSINSEGEATQNVETNYSLVLRGAGDDELEDTTGVTLELLVDEYGVPNPFVPVPVFPDAP